MSTRQDALFDRDAETALLSACLYSKQARITARKIITSPDFYQPVHEAIFDLMGQMDRDGREVDAVTVMSVAMETHAQDRLRGIKDAVTALMTAGGVASAAADYAGTVRGWAIRRRVAAEARGVLDRAIDPTESPERLVSEAVTRLTSLRDTGTTAVARSLGALMADEDEDDTPHWVIPHLLESGDRFMLTGTEGVGKSALSRQLAICSAAGIHPFTEAVMPPIRALIVECENKDRQVRRQSRPLVNWLQQQPGAQNPYDRVWIDTPGRINLTRDRDLSRIHQMIDDMKPDLLVLGPLYKMSDRALQTDDEAAPFLAALDTLMERGPAMIIEAHAGHTQEGVGRQQQRNLRPRGSSALLGWPEFGMGLKNLGHGLADLEPWRGHREQRAWPSRLRRSPGNRWLETHPDDRGTDGGYPGGIDPKWHGYQDVSEPVHEPGESQGTLDV